MEKENWLIDINCDVGEGFEDALIIPWVSSANIATGFHAGSPAIMSSCIELCLEHHVKIGAHPSFWDRENFGRIVQSISKRELRDILLYQIGAMYQICEAYGTQLHHVKPHGALYNLSAQDESIARVVAQTVQEIDSNIVLYGLAGSFSVSVAQEMGLKVYAEGFADRRYHSNGQLVSRKNPLATYEKISDSLHQALSLTKGNSIKSIEGELIQLEVDTICVHGDQDGAIELAKQIALEIDKLSV